MTEPCFILVGGLLAYMLLRFVWRIGAWMEENHFRDYVRKWCLKKVKDDKIAITGAGVEAMVDCICKRMEGRSDRWDCELYISPSVYRRIANEYRRKGW